MNTVPLVVGWLLGVAAMAQVPATDPTPPQSEAAPSAPPAEPTPARPEAPSTPLAEPTLPKPEAPSLTLPAEPVPPKTSAVAASKAPAKPWRLAEALGAPSWLRFGLEHRARYEHLEPDFRATTPGESLALSLRTRASAEARASWASAVLEVQDARAYAGDKTPLNTTHVDPLDLLQAQVTLRREGLAAGADATLTLGRFTMDVGSRRLVARNDFRNTTNTFTGFDAQWTNPARGTARLFAVTPVTRLPSDAAALAQNKLVLDRESFNALFWGAVYASPKLASGILLEAYVLGLHEKDAADAPSANRRLVTPGARLHRPPATGRVDFQVEAMLQLGLSRASTAATDAQDLTHWASSVHVAVGHRFDLPGSPRLSLQYDYASGDASPQDGENGRFDPLFGARRFDFGPTGIYGAFARANLSSPGLRLEGTFPRSIEAFASYRLCWLASPRDAWTTAGVRDAQGTSGDFLGHQLEVRARWNVLPRNVGLELGAAYLRRGTFATTAPGGRQDAPLYGYLQLTGSI